MARHHAFLITGDVGEGVERALSYAQEELGLNPVGNPDVQVVRSMQCSVEDARAIGEASTKAAFSGTRLIVIATERIYPEAQNALLKTFEEPPMGTTLVLVVPSAGMLLPTLRSRLIPLSPSNPHTDEKHEAHVFLQGSPKERESVVEAILAQAKKDAPEEKQKARTKALQLLNGLTHSVYLQHREAPQPMLTAVLRDLDRLTPLLYERSAPLKGILEHVLLVCKSVPSKR